MRIGALSLLLVVTLGLAACNQPIQGQFGWSATDDRGLVEPEKSLLIEKSYRLARSNLYFFDYETIWMVYQISEGTYDPGEGFIVALYENNDTPNPVEVDLRQVLVQQSDGKGYIRQQYDPLNSGRYLLKIAYNSVMFDQIKFQVVPPGGPGSDKDIITGMDVDTENRDGETDDIIKYSS